MSGAVLRSSRRPTLVRQEQTMDAVERVEDWLAGMRVDQAIALTNQQYADLWQLVSLARSNGWQDIASAPTNEMFIWARPKGGGKWGLGLAYRNVSGGWSDAYGAPAADATKWHALPEPPVAALRTKGWG
jgi:hypothetical protein